MYRNLLFLLFLALASMALVGTVVADDHKPAAKDAAKAVKTKQEAKTTTDAKELSGISIVGNDEAPKSLYIVPWKSSEIGVETSMGMMLNEAAMPVDRDVFMRQLEFFEVSTEK